MLPSRDAAIGDIFWNIAGIAAGIAMALPRRVREAVLHQSVGQSQLIAVLFLGCWLIAELAPFVPSLDLQSFKDSIQPLWQSSSFSMLALLRDSVAWIVIAYIVIRSFSPRTAWPLVVLAMCGTLLAKIVIVNNTLTPADVAAMPVALIGALVLGKQGSRQSITLIWLLAGVPGRLGIITFQFSRGAGFPLDTVYRLTQRINAPESESAGGQGVFYRRTDIPRTGLRVHVETDCYRARGEPSCAGNCASLGRHAHAGNNRYDPRSFHRQRFSRSPGCRYAAYPIQRRRERR